MNDWKLEKLGNITHKIGSGATPRGGKNVYLDNGIPLIRSQNIYNGYFNHSGLAFLSEKSAKELENVIVQKNDNLINITGDSVCRSTIVPDNLINSRVNQHVMIIRPIQQVLHYRYLHYFLISPSTQKILYSFSDSGGTRKALTKEMVSELEIPLPSLTTQQKIADILGSLDDKIELNRQMNQTLEAMARAIFKSWFVDFDPVYAKMEGRDYPLPPEIMDLFPDELEESELGLIPKGWRVGKVENNIEIQNGFAFKSEDYITDGVFVFRTKNFSTYNNCERLKDDVFLPNDFLQSHKKFICQPFDFHVVMVGASVGKTSIIYPNCLPALRNQNMWCFRPNKQFLYRHFINLLMKNLIQQKLTWASGSARDFFRKSDFYDFNVIYPEKRLLEKFENIINSMFQKISLNLSSTDILVSTREQLSPKLLKGEIDING